MRLLWFWLLTSDQAEVCLQGLWHMQRQISVLKEGELLFNITRNRCRSKLPTQQIKDEHQPYKQISHPQHLMGMNLGGMKGNWCNHVQTWGRWQRKQKILCIGKSHRDNGTMLHWNLMLLSSSLCSLCVTLLDTLSAHPKKVI